MEQGVNTFLISINSVVMLNELTLIQMSVRDY